MYSYTVDSDLHERSIAWTCWCLEKCKQCLTIGTTKQYEILKDLAWSVEIRLLLEISRCHHSVFSKPTNKNGPKPWVYLFHYIEHFKSVNYFPKDGVESIKMGLLGITDEKLASICIWPAISHRQHSSSIVLDQKQFWINKHVQVTMHVI